jgi:hypothetical protein
MVNMNMFLPYNLKLKSTSKPRSSEAIAFSFGRPKASEFAMKGQAEYVTQFEAKLAPSLSVVKKLYLARTLLQNL